MKEHPIIFSTDMVKAILDGRKTQTRRVIKPQPREHWQRGMPFVYKGCILSAQQMVSNCPYGQAGDRLWVRETIDLDQMMYVADKSYCEMKDMNWYNQTQLAILPSIFMPRWASRITLEITGVRVERLQRISLNDIRAEGIPDNRATYNAPIQLEKFTTLWDSLNAKRGYGWEVNPWVWVIEFRREK